MEPAIERTYPSKRDGWLVAVIWFGTLSLAAGAALQLFVPGPLVARLAVAAALLAGAAFSPWIVYSTRYTLDPDRLLVRSGPFRWTVPLAAIVTVRPTHNVLSSPACSLDRLGIRYGRWRYLMISPEDKAGFLRDLAALTPGLVVEGETARRAPGTPVLASPSGP